MTTMIIFFTAWLGLILLAHILLVFRSDYLKVKNDINHLFDKYDSLGMTLFLLITLCIFLPFTIGYSIRNILNNK